MGAGIILLRLQDFPKRRKLNVTSELSVGIYCDGPIVINLMQEECLLHLSESDVISNQNPLYLWLYVILVF